MKTVTATFRIAVFQAWLRKQVTWSRAAILVRSPIARLAASVPLLGYLVLYGDQFQGIFSFSEGALKTEVLWLDTAARTRLLYYGALLIAIAVGIYLFRCPDICRRHKNHQLAVDEFVRIGSSEDILSAIKPIPSTTGDAPLMTEMQKAIEDLARAISYKAKGALGDQAVIATWPATEFLQAATPKAIMQNEGSELHYVKLTDFVDAMITIDTHSEFSRNVDFKLSLRKNFLFSIYSIRDRVPQVAMDENQLMRTHFESFNQKNPVSIVFVATLSVVGLFLTALPAADVLNALVCKDFELCIPR